MGRMPSKNGGRKVAIPYCSNIGGKYGMKKDVLGSNTVQIIKKQRRRKS